VSMWCVYSPPPSSSCVVLELVRFGSTSSDAHTNYSTRVCECVSQCVRLLYHRRMCDCSECGRVRAWVRVIRKGWPCGVVCRGTERGIQDGCRRPETLVCARTYTVAAATRTRSLFSAVILPEHVHLWRGT